MRSGKQIKSIYDVEIDDQFSKLTIKELAYTKTKTGRDCPVSAYVECECGNKVWRKLVYILREETKSCGCAHRRTRHKNNKYIGAYKDISIAHFRNIQRVAISKGREFSISIEYLWSVWESQNFKCALSGVDLTWRPVYHRTDTTASVDRIDSKKGYVEGNIQIIHKALNRLKNACPQEEFLEWCRLVVENHPRNGDQTPAESKWLLTLRPSED
jgi:hypothetical protein